MTAATSPALCLSDRLELARYADNEDVNRKYPRPCRNLEISKSNGTIAEPAGAMTADSLLKVLCVNDVAYVMETLIPELTRLGIDVSLIGRVPANPSLGRDSFASNALKIQSAMRKSSDFDLLHINYGLYGFFSLGSHKPCIVHCHGSDIRPGKDPRTKIANVTTRISGRLAEQIWYSTTDLGVYFDRAHLEARYMPNPVAQTFFTVAPVRGDRIRILFAIPLTRLKGAADAISAMRQLARTYPDIQISAFGFGPDPREAAAFVAQIPPSVRIVCWTEHSSMPSIFSEATIVVGRLHLKSLGMTELEAMAGGRPLVAEIPSLLEAEDYYRQEPPIVHCHDSSTIVEGVRDLIEDRDLLVRTGQLSRKWAMDYHLSSEVARLYSNEYRSLV